MNCPNCMAGSTNQCVFFTSQGRVGPGQVGSGMQTLVEELIDDGVSGMDALFVKCGYMEL